MARDNFIISFLEQENNKLKVNQLPLEKYQFKAILQDVKGKVMVDSEELYKHEEQVIRKMPMTMGI